MFFAPKPGASSLKARQETRLPENVPSPGGVSVSCGWEIDLLYSLTCAACMRR